MKALFVLLFVSGGALADDATMLQCRSIAGVAAGVACYDAIPVGAAAPLAADGSSAVLSPMTNAKLKVERHVIGTCFLKIEGTNNSPTVRRVQYS